MIYGFMHVALMNHGYEIFKEQLYKIEHTGLYDKCDKIFISCVHNQQSSKHEFKNLPSKYEQITDHHGTQICELITVNEVIKFSKAQSNNKKVFYIHTKGASNPISYINIYWRKYMEYYNLVLHEQCIDYLNAYDICGVHYRENKYFAGNFWWANTDYIKKVSLLDTSKIHQMSFHDYRHLAQYFISEKNPKVKSMFKYKQHPAFHPIHPFKYIKKIY